MKKYLSSSSPLVILLLLLLSISIRCVHGNETTTTTIVEMETTEAADAAAPPPPQSKVKSKAGFGKSEPDLNVIFPMVATPLGKLRGQAMTSRAGRWYYSFRGIPFAQPPERFKPALPVEPWEGILDARKNGSICPQINIFTGQFDGDENCLFVNVEFPHYDRCQTESDATGGLPVLFHIHGGSFSAAAGSDFGGQYLMDECIVYVSINYRLGVLGFLTTGDDVIPGNLGMKDQILALKWTKEYISYFRGNPDLVTITGISSGGFAVSLMVTSPMASGLFSRVIAQSGTTVSHWSVQRQARSHANALGLKVNCPVDTSEALKECLLTKDVQEIIKNQADGTPIPFGPTIEPDFANEPFQTENPAVVLKRGDFNRVPLIAGFMQDEGVTLLAGGILLDPNKTSLLNSSWSELAPAYLAYNELNLEESEKNRISAEIRQFYFGTESIGEGTRQSLVNLFSDRNFIQGTFETVELHGKFAPAYPYVLTFKGGFSSSSTVGYETPGASHADDVQYLYVAWGLKGLDFGSDPYLFSRQLITHWVHFARTGEPYNSFGEPWTAVTGSGNANWHKLDLVETNLVNYLDERRTFWKNLGLLDHEMTLTP